MNEINNLTPHQLRQAADIQEKIFTLRLEFEQLLDSASIHEIVAPAGKRRRLSAQAIANIRAGARKRWGKARVGNAATSRATSRKRGMSAAGRASIARRMKARWAAAKRAGRNAL